MSGAVRQNDSARHQWPARLDRPAAAPAPPIGCARPRRAPPPPAPGDPKQRRRLARPAVPARRSRPAPRTGAQATPRDPNYPRRDVPGPCCERRHLPPARVTALSNSVPVRGAAPLGRSRRRREGRRCRAPRAENPPGGGSSRLRF